MVDEQPAYDVSERRHEPEGTSPRGTMIGAILFLLSLALILICIRGVFRWYRTLLPGRVPGNAPTQLATSPVQPWLDPVGDLAQLRQREDERLNTYAWVDRDPGVVRIPIERAMELLATEHPRPPASQPTLAPRKQGL